MSFFQFLAKRLCAFVILAILAPPVWSANPLPQNRESDSTIIFGETTPRANSNLALDSDDASPLLAQAKTSSGSLEWDILYEGAEKLRNQGDYLRGIFVARKALEIAETSFGKNDINTVKSIRLLVSLYELKGHSAAAKSLLKRALAISEKIREVRTAPSFNSLVGLCKLQGSPSDAAEPPFKYASVICDKILEEQYLDLNHLVKLCKSQVDYAAAESSSKRSWVICEKILEAPLHIEVATSLNDSANNKSNDDYANAENFHKRALAIRGKILGAQHPDTASSLNNLAGLYRKQGDYATAEPFYTRAWAIFRAMISENHPTAAEPFYKRAWTISSAMINESHPKSQVNYAIAEQLYKRALAIREKTLGAQHLSTATSLNNLALLYYLQEDYAAAEPLLKRTLAIFKKTLGESHRSTVTALKNLSHLYEAMGESAKALEYNNLAKQARARQ